METRHPDCEPGSPEAPPLGSVAPTGPVRHTSTQGECLRSPAGRFCSLALLSARVPKSRLPE